MYHKLESGLIKVDVRFVIYDKSKKINRVGIFYTLQTYYFKINKYVKHCF